MCSMKTCSFCGQELQESSRFCTRCGRAVAGPAQSNRVATEARPERPDAEQMNLPMLYAMVGLLIVAVLFPPWETPPGQSPEFLGFNFILSPSEPDSVVSRLLITIELVTIAMAGIYLSWLFRKRS